MSALCGKLFAFGVLPTVYLVDRAPWKVSGQEQGCAASVWPWLGVAPSCVASVELLHLSVLHAAHLQNGTNRLRCQGLAFSRLQSSIRWDEYGDQMACDVSTAWHVEAQNE